MVARKRKGGRIIILLALIVILGLVAVYFLFFMNKPGKNPTENVTPTPGVEMVDIVVTSQFVSRGSLLTADVLTTIKYPKQELPMGTFFTNIEDVVGTKAKYNLDAALPITASMLIEESGGSLASFDIPTGMTAFSIPITPETAVGYAPQKGDHVMVVGCMLLTDVDTSFQTNLPDWTASASKRLVYSETESLTSYSLDFSTATGAIPYGRFEIDPTTNQLIYLIPSESQRARPVCQTFISDAQILQLGNAYQEYPQPGETIETNTTVPAGETTETTTNQIQLPDSVTLIVSPQDTVILNYLLVTGTQLSIALRSAGDIQPISTEPVTLQYVMDQKNIPSPLKLPYSIEPRVDSLSFPQYGDYYIP
jgi:pilus assembly protein CpaB